MNISRDVLLLLSAVIIATTGAPLGSQTAAAIELGSTSYSAKPRQSTPVFKVRGVTVSMQATVSDGRRLVTDLTADDFTIFDNGRPQPLTVFRREVRPMSVVMLFDTSMSMENSIGLVREGARQFVNHLLPTDRVELATFNSQIWWVRPFTNDRTRLNRLLDFLEPRTIGPSTALWMAIDRSINELEPVEGQKVLLVFSDGENNVRKGPDSLRVRLRAITNDVMVYAIALKTTYTINGQTQHSELDKDLPLITEATGGGYVELKTSDELGATFKQIIDELHQQYTLGFEAPELDGKMHDITVKVRGKDLTVRTRRNYRASK